MYQCSGEARGGAEGAAVLPEILRKLKIYFNGQLNTLQKS